MDLIPSKEPYDIDIDLDNQIINEIINLSNYISKNYNINDDNIILSYMNSNNYSYIFNNENNEYKYIFKYKLFCNNLTISDIKNIENNHIVSKLTIYNVTNSLFTLTIPDENTLSYLLYNNNGNKEYIMKFRKFIVKFNHSIIKIFHYTYDFIKSNYYYNSKNFKICYIYYM